jgi:hypothetical protein
MNGKGRSIVVMASVVSLSGFVARAELPVSATLTAHEITPDEAVLSSHDEGSVLKLAQNAEERLSGSPSASSMHETQAAQGVLHGSSEAPTPGHDAGTPGLQGPPAAATRAHVPRLEGDQDVDHGVHQHDSGPSGHMMGVEDEREHMTGHTGEASGPSGDMSGHMDGARMDHSRMHETGTMGGPAGGMMSGSAPGQDESMMEPAGSMMGGDAVPEMHHGDGIMGGSSHEGMHDGMMGGATEGDAGGRMHRGSKGPETGSPGGGHTGGMMGGGG